MENSASKTPARNPETEKRHVQQLWVQILLPLLIITAGLIVLGVLAAIGGPAGDPQTTAIWAHISTIFMALLLMAAGLVAFLFILLVIFGLGWLNSRLPGYTYIAQLYTLMFSRRIGEFADKASRPMIQAKSSWAGSQALWQKLISRMHKRT